MKSTKAHYVYKITNLNPSDERKYYIGVRTAPNGNPQNDTKYMSSSRYLKEAIKENGLENFYKEILSAWATREEALAEEIRLHSEYDVNNNILFYNKSKQLTKRFDTSGYVVVIDTRDNQIKSVSREEYHNNTFYTTCSTNKVTVKDIKTGKVMRITKEEFHNRSDIQFHTKNKLVAYDEKGVKHYVTREEYKKNKLLKHTATNTVVARNIITGERTRISKELFDSDSNWISLNLELGLANIIHVYDANDNLVKVYNGNFDPQCRKDNLPYAELSKSYKSGGNYRIYPSVINGTAKKCLISKLTNNMNIHYVGWYAKIVK